MAEVAHTTAGTEVPAEHHEEASALGLNAGGWVALADPLAQKDAQKDN